jgi:hypothetical protein
MTEIPLAPKGGSRGSAIPDNDLIIFMINNGHYGHYKKNNKMSVT